jgi:hypothetical protein
MAPARVHSWKLKLPRNRKVECLIPCASSLWWGEATDQPAREDARPTNLIGKGLKLRTACGLETRDTAQLGTSSNQTSADFQVCCVADFQIRGPSELDRATDFEVGDPSSVARLAKRLRLFPELLRRVDTAGLETCATDEV